MFKRQSRLAGCAPPIVTLANNPPCVAQDRETDVQFFAPSGISVGHPWSRTAELRNSGTQEKKKRTEGHPDIQAKRQESLAKAQDVEKNGESPGFVPFLASLHLGESFRSSTSRRAGMRRTRRVKIVPPDLTATDIRVPVRISQDDQSLGFISGFIPPHGLLAGVLRSPSLHAPTGPTSIILTGSDEPRNLCMPHTPPALQPRQTRPGDIFGPQILTRSSSLNTANRAR